MNNFNFVYHPSNEDTFVNLNHITSIGKREDDELIEDCKVGKYFIAFYDMEGDARCPWYFENKQDRDDTFNALRTLISKNFYKIKNDS